MKEFLNNSFLDNPVKSWLIAIGIILCALILLRGFKTYLLARLKNWVSITKSHFDDFIMLTVEKNIYPFLYFLALYIGLSFLSFPTKPTQVINIIILTIGTFFIIRTITSFIKYSLYRVLGARDNQKKKQLRGIIVIVSIVVWLIGLLFLIDNLGYDITTAVAGLGIGGIAIALAAQTILGDLFSYFVIYFDKPFEIGDFITVDDKMGTVESVGIKTTRIRTLSGEELICSNTNLTNSRVHNYKRMLTRRIEFKIGVVYHTPAAKIKLIPQIFRDIIESLPDTKFDRAHFSSFGDFSMNIVCVYFVLSPDFNLYMDRQQEINLRLLEIFEQEKIEFAFPTQTILLASSDSNQEKHNMVLHER